MLEQISFWFHQNIQRYAILVRILIVNFAVISAGAIIATSITRRMGTLTLVELVLLFFLLGVLFSLAMNYWLIRTVLLPLHELRIAVDQVQFDPKYILETDLMRSDPDIHRLVEAINSMLERLDQRTRMLSALSERAINAQEEERKRIARTLHDDTAQSLSTLIIQLEQLEEQYGFSSPEMKSPLAKSRQLASNILEDLRKNIWNLRPSILDDLGLCPAIRWFARLCLGEAGINVDFDLPSENFRLPAHLETMLFRVTQEAVNNIIRHSDAQNVRMYLTLETTDVCLTIEDDGCGFDVATMKEDAVSRKRLGLLGIQERTSLVDGKLEIKSQPHLGTVLKIIIPIEPEIIHRINETGSFGPSLN